MAGDGVCETVIVVEVVGVMDGLPETDGDPDGVCEGDGEGVTASIERANLNEQQVSHVGDGLLV